MKNLKISLTAIVLAILLTISTGVYAYTGEGDVDPDYAISMPGTLSNGAGNVSGVSGAMEYQFVEITEAKYNEIKKLEAQFELIQVYVSYAANPTDEGLTNSWNAACEKYAKKYGNGSTATNQVVTEVLNQYGIGPDILKLCRNAWIVALPNFDASKWESATSSKIELDITKFEGTKYYVAWVKSGEIYDAEAYVVKGTGSKKDDNKTDNTTKNDNTIKNDNTAKKDNGTVTPNTTTKTDTTASSSGKILPKTGISSTVLGLIAVAGASAGVSYRKYRKIK